MNAWQAALFSFATTFAASSGFWTFLITKREKRSSTSKLLLGLAHDKLVHLTKEHISNGYITSEAYDVLNKYLYLPYKELDGNGTIDKLMGEVSRLPIKTSANS